MKKIFGLFVVAALAVVGLSGCGGGGGSEAKGFVSPAKFRSGKGFLLLGTPSLTIEPNNSQDMPGHNPTLPDGKPSVFDIPYPGTGSPEVEDDTATPEDEYRPAIPDQILTPVGDRVAVERTITVKSGAQYTSQYIVYTMTQENIGVAECYLSGAALKDEDIINAFGISAPEGGNNNNNGGESNLDRMQLDSVAGCMITIYFDFNTGMARTVISASGVNFVDENGNETGFVATPEPITFGSGSFRVL